jgi:hypothetical protein
VRSAATQMKPIASRAVPRRPRPHAPGFPQRSEVGDRVRIDGGRLYRD